MGEIVDFTDISSPNGGSQIVSWYWNFGDPASGVNNTSTAKNPSHLFTEAQSYNVVLLVTNQDGCTDSISKLVFVNTPQNADFTAERDTACVEEIIQFYGIGDSITSWYWDFGDGGSNIIQNPEYSYHISSTYDVSLTIEDVNGCSNDITHQVVVKPLPNALYEVPTPVCASNTVEFTDYSTSSSSFIIQWHWYFGDGQDTIVNYPDIPNVNHIYNSPGTYASKLIVTDNYGCIDSLTMEIQVNNSPIVNLIKLLHVSANC